MAIWGESYSKMKTSDSRVITLGHSIIRPTWQEQNRLIQRSIINGVKNFVTISKDFAIFDVVVNLWKFGDPEGKLWEIKREDDTDVKFMPHQDSGNYLKTASGIEANFHIIRMVPYYIKNEPPQLEDRLLIIFESKVYVDILADFTLSAPGEIKDGLGDTIKDGLGDKIKAGI